MCATMCKSYANLIQKQKAVFTASVTRTPHKEFCLRNRYLIMRQYFYTNVVI